MRPGHDKKGAGRFGPQVVSDLRFGPKKKQLQGPKRRVRNDPIYDTPVRTLKRRVRNDPIQETASVKLLVEIEMLNGNPKEFVPNPPLLSRMVNRHRPYVAFDEN